MFSVASTSLIRDELTNSMANDKAGALVIFEGQVRNHNEGKKVTSLEYQIYHELALKEGTKILEEAKAKFNLHDIKSVHREGHLNLGEIAIWIGATASHRDDAFRATRYVIDEIKHRLPVWKKEHYSDQKPEWVFCKHHHHHVHFSEAEYYQKQSKVIEQNILKHSKVLVIGAGGLGCPVLTSLAAAGVGSIGICDSDKISISNIHRQFLYTPNLVGEKKVAIAASRLLEMNPFIRVFPYDHYFSESSVELVREYDLIIDCTDNMATKFLVHDLCFLEKKPLISASVFKAEAQIRTFVPGSHEGCLRCQVAATPNDAFLGNCNDFGVTGATTNVIGSLQASEALIFLQKNSNNTMSHTYFINLSDLSQLKIKNRKEDGCLTCKGVGHFSKNELEISKDYLTSDFQVLDIREMNDENLDSYKKSKNKIALCCHRGVRSLELTQKLRSEGHSHFYSLKGGATALF